MRICKKAESIFFIDFLTFLVNMPYLLGTMLFTEKKMYIIEYSTVGFDESNYKKKIEEALNYLRMTDYKLGIQIHNSINKEFADKLTEYSNDLTFSVHSPAAGDYFLNLASNQSELIFKEIDKAAKYLEKFNTDIFFFHGFFATDNPIQHSMKNYRTVMRDSIGEEIALDNSFTMNPAFFETDKYRKFETCFCENYFKLKKLYPQYIVGLENDFIGIGSCLQRPKEIDKLIDNLWFDLGHFWCSSLVHGFDYYKESYRLIEEKKIIGVHINHNLMTKLDPITRMRDSHDHIYKPCAQELEPVVRRLAKNGLKRFTLEIVDADLLDIKTLIQWLS